MQFFKESAGKRADFIYTIGQALCTPRLAYQLPVRRRPRKLPGFPRSDCGGAGRRRRREWRASALCRRGAGCRRSRRRRSFSSCSAGGIVRKAAEKPGNCCRKVSTTSCRRSNSARNFTQKRLKKNLTAHLSLPQVPAALQIAGDVHVDEGGDGVADFRVGRRHIQMQLRRFQVELPLKIREQPQKSRL